MSTHCVMGTLCSHNPKKIQNWSKKNPPCCLLLGSPGLPNRLGYSTVSASMEARVTMAKQIFSKHAKCMQKSQVALVKAVEKKVDTQKVY